MSVYADSSFLASLYLPDGHFAAANQTMRTAGVALPLTSFGAFELKNAIRAVVVRRSVTEAEARRVLSLIQQDTNTGQLVPRPPAIGQRFTAKLSYFPSGTR